MASMLSSSDAPMRISEPKYFIERAYREMAQLQWAREATQNTNETGEATTIHFTTEWVAVERHGVHRRVIADDGPGIPIDDWNGLGDHPLERFFTEFGGSGKPIGGAHDNFGIGVKAALLPWNTYGLVVISVTDEVDEDGNGPLKAMIHLRRDPKTGEYGARRWETEDGWTAVVQPGWDDELDLDWDDVMPEVTAKAGHGLILVLLGDSPTQDTVLGDPNREHNPDKPRIPGWAISEYIRSRYWDLDITVKVDEYRGKSNKFDRKKWPKVPTREVGGKVIYGSRTVLTAQEAIYAGQGKEGVTYADGQMDLSDGSTLRWILYDGPDRTGFVGDGYIAALYHNELYDLRGIGAGGHAIYRQWGVSEKSVRERLWLIVEPPESDASGRGGVYPTQDRSRLLMQGSPHHPKAGTGLPWDEWAEEFRANMPDEIAEAISKARANEAKSDEDLNEEVRRRLQDRFGSRWRRIALRAHKKGTQRTNVSMPAVQSRPSNARPRPKPQPNPNPSPRRGTLGTPGAGVTPTGPTPAIEVKKAAGLPEYRWKSQHEHDFEPGQFAEWNPPSGTDHSGVVILNRDHPILLEEIEYWVDRYAAADENLVVGVLEEVYGSQAIAVIAHSESLRPHLPDVKYVEDKLRDCWALTAALCGLVGVEHQIATRLGGKLGKAVN